MSMKSLILAATAVAMTATAASANNFFADDNLASGDTLEIGAVSANGAGVVEIYDFRLGTQGALLGTEAVTVGLNTDVRINVGFAPKGDVLAVLKVDGQAVSSNEFYIN